MGVTTAYTTQEGERIAGQLLGVPVVVKGLTWFPANQIVLWVIMSWVAGREHRQWSWRKRFGTGALTMTIILGSEWLHNLAHTATANWIGKPVDAVRIFMGIPLLVYTAENDSSATPEQHIQRAVGGPIFNAFLLVLASLARSFTQPDSVPRAAADAAVGMNAFLCTASLLPIPGIDGGPIFKWCLVKHGKTPQEADATVVNVNRMTAAGLGLAAGYSLKHRQWLVGAIFSLFSVLSLAIGLGVFDKKRSVILQKGG